MQGCREEDGGCGGGGLSGRVMGVGGVRGGREVSVVHSEEALGFRAVGVVGGTAQHIQSGVCLLCCLAAAVAAAGRARRCC